MNKRQREKRAKLMVEGKWPLPKKADKAQSVPKSGRKKSPAKSASKRKSKSGDFWAKHDHGVRPKINGHKKFQSVPCQHRHGKERQPPQRNDNGAP